MKTCRLVLPSVLVVLVLQIGLGWAQPPKYGGTLRIALSGEPAFFNANQGPAPGAPAFFISNSIYNSLLTITPPPALTIVPDLATSWDVGVMSAGLRPCERPMVFSCGGGCQVRRTKASGKHV